VKFFGTLLIAASVTFSANAQDTEKLFQKTCGFCHVSGVAGAPKVGDKAAWEPRLARGMAAMLESVENGKGAMPPKGMCAKCSTADYKALIDYMATQ